MAALSIRNLDDDVVARLRVRAAKHGRSMEAEAREILADAVGDAPRRGLAHALHETFSGRRGVELELPPREPGRAAPDFR